VAVPRPGGGAHHSDIRRRNSSSSRSNHATRSQSFSATASMYRFLIRKIARQERHHLDTTAGSDAVASSEYKAGTSSSAGQIIEKAPGTGTTNHKRGLRPWCAATLNTGKTRYRSRRLSCRRVPYQTCKNILYDKHRTSLCWVLNPASAPTARHGR
jgi:hypothetical protein